MLGWINDCTESLVVTKFGIEKWHEIKLRANCTVEDGGFIRRQSYSDESTVSLVVAASEVLGITVDQVLEVFGQYFMEVTREEGYENLLSCQGSTLRLWLSNLNALHNHLQVSLPEGCFPVFWCEDDEHTKGAILLHYSSKRGNLLVPLVVGIVKEVARYHFDVSIDMTLIQKQDENDAQFTTWRISASDPSLQWKLGSKHAVVSNLGECKSDILSDTSIAKKVDCISCLPFRRKFFTKNSNEISSKKSPDNEKTRNDQSTKITPSIIPMSGDKMMEVFPFHIVVNNEFLILQIGKQLRELLGLDLSILGTPISRLLRIARPILGSWSWDYLSKIEDQTIYLEPTNMNAIKVKLRGNIIHLSADPKQVMFSLSPSAKTVHELTNMQLTLSDLPLHNFQRDAIYLGERISYEVKAANRLDKLRKRIANEHNLSKTLLYSILPKHVADDLRNGKASEPVSHDNVTLLFSDVVDFNEMCIGLHPWDVIDLLNQLYTVMDYLAQKFNLYKVETIGDTYMCCSGLITENEFHAQDVANFAIAARESVKLVTSPLTGDPMRLKIGIHTGSCMSGVVGTLTPHYCLFGDMINTAARHAQTGEADRIHTSSVFYSRITQSSEHSEQYQFEPNDFVYMKGKGRLFTYWLNHSTDSNSYTGPTALKDIHDEVETLLSKNEKWKRRSYFRKHRNSLTSETSSYTHFLDLDLFSFPSEEDNSVDEISVDENSDDEINE